MSEYDNKNDNDDNFALNMSDISHLTPEYFC